MTIDAALLDSVLAALVLAVWLLATVELGRGRRAISALASVDPTTLPTPSPRVSVVVAARDEERHIEQAMRSLLALDYPGLELIAVNDRSTDRTGALLDALAASDPRLRVIHVAALPAGWLGKNHALHLAGQAAQGEWVLFTDADVFFAPDALRRAVAHAEASRLDHLVLGPKLIGGSVALRLMMAFFALSFALSIRPWRAREAGRAEHIGIGAFNLVRRRALAAVGFHSRIPLRPDDDLKLGRLLKAGGHAQEFMEGGATVTIEWYRTVWEMVRGLEKNSFPYLEYSVAKALAAIAAIGLLVLWPPLALFLTSGVAFALSLITVLLTLALVAASAVRTVALPAWSALGYPFGGLMMMVTIANSTVRTLLQGGVVWRGTLYPLAALKANRI